MLLCHGRLVCFCCDALEPMLSVRAMISFGWPMMSSRRAAWIVVVSGVAVATIASGAGRRSYTIDPSRSSATIEVGKAGVLSFAAGHTHEVIAPPWQER